MASRTTNLSLLRLPEHLRKKMNSPDPIFSPSVTRGADGLHCMFSPQDAPSEHKSELEAINENHIFTTDSLLSPDQPVRQTRIGNRIYTTDSLISPESPIKRGQIGSPYSIVSQTTIDSFKTAASIEMLSLPYIERCTSEETLEQIMTHLKEDGNYPSLLWSTEQRLATIREQLNQPYQPHSFSGLYQRNESSMVKANPLKSERDHEISLQMSLSTDYDDDATSPVNQIYISKANAPVELFEKKSQDEIRLLEEMIKKLEVRYARECNLNESTIRTLNNAIEATEQKSQRLQNEVNAIKNENVELYRLVKNKTEEVDKVKSTLSGSEMLKHELLSQIHQLKTQLTEAESKALDRTYPRKIHALEQLLQSAQKNIREVQQERDSMLKGIFHMQGKEAPSKLSKEARQQIISDFRTDSNSLKVALEKAMVSLSHAEQNAISERHRAKMIKQKSERQLKEATKKIAELENEVATFILTMEKMERSLKECEQRSLKDKNEWEAREQRYKEKVRELSKQPNGVPMSLFKLIKDESETRKLEIQKLRKKSSELESTLLQWDTQAKASMSKMRSEADRAAAISQRVHQEKASLLQSKKSSSLTKPNTLASYHPAKKQLAVQTHSPRELNGPVSNPTRVPPTDPPLREHINWVFSGAQVTPKGSKKINVATIPIRGEPGSVALRSSERAAKVSSKIGAKVHEKATGSMNCQATSQMEATKHPVSVRSDKENQGNKVTFSFPTPDEKNGQTGQNLRLKMVREAGGRKGLLEKLEKMRSPRSSMCSLDEKATQ